MLWGCATAVFDTLDPVLFIGRPLLVLVVPVRCKLIPHVVHHGYPVQRVVVLPRSVNAEVTLKWFKKFVDYI